MAGTARRFFDERWIDVPARPGKDSGAFSHPVVPSAHPYILLNYQGRARDVMTLAHELGHGVHQVLAGGQGHLHGRHAADAGRDRLGVRRDADLPPPAAGGDRPGRRRTLLAGKVEDMLNTVVRQIAFHEFETGCTPSAAGRAGGRRHLRDLARGPAREPGPGDPLRRRLPVLLDLHPALHPLAVLRLRLCVRRLPGELALRHLRGKPSRLRGEVPGHAAGRRLAAPQRAAGAVRPRVRRTRRSGSGALRWSRA